MTNDPVTGWTVLNTMAGTFGSIAWAVVVVFAAYLFREPLKTLLEGLSGLKTAGVEIQFRTREAVDAAIQLARKHDDWPVVVPEADRERVVRRASRNLALCKGRRILWLDDRPANNRNERRMFMQIGIDVEPVTTTDQALAALAPDQGGYDLILSDMSRPEEDKPDKPAGIAFVEKYKERQGRIPVIFYIGTPNPSKGVPAGAFGVAHRPDELLHLVLDALERRR